MPYLVTEEQTFWIVLVLFALVAGIFLGLDIHKFV